MRDGVHAYLPIDLSRSNASRRFLTLADDRRCHVCARARARFHSADDYRPIKRCSPIITVCNRNITEATGLMTYRFTCKKDISSLDTISRNSRESANDRRQFDTRFARVICRGSRRSRPFRALQTRFHDLRRRFRSANQQLSQPHEERAFAGLGEKTLARSRRCSNRRIANTASSLISRAVVKHRVSTDSCSVRRRRRKAKRGKRGARSVAAAVAAAASGSVAADHAGLPLLLSRARAILYAAASPLLDEKPVDRDRTGALLAEVYRKTTGELPLGPVNERTRSRAIEGESRRRD